MGCLLIPAVEGLLAMSALSSGEHVPEDTQVDERAQLQSKLDALVEMESKLMHMRTIGISEEEEATGGVS